MSKSSLMSDSNDEVSELSSDDNGAESPNLKESNSVTPGSESLEDSNPDEQGDEEQTEDATEDEELNEQKDAKKTLHMKPFTVPSLGSPFSAGVDILRGTTAHTFCTPHTYTHMHNPLAGAQQQNTSHLICNRPHCTTPHFLPYLAIRNKRNPKDDQ